MTKERSLLNAAWMIALLTIFSKFIGFIRDIVIANYYGAGLVSDSYFYAYQIPSLALILLGGVGGPFHSAIVSVFSKLIPDINNKVNEKLNRLFNTILTSSFLAFMAFAILIFIFADIIMQFIISGGSPELVNLATLHLKIMSPIIVIGGIIGIYYGILISYKKFLVPAISPSMVSFIIIFLVLLVQKDTTGTVLTLATTLGALCQFIILLPQIKKLGYKLKPNLAIFHNQEYKNILELLFPAILSSTVGQIYIYVDMFFASHLVEGAWTAIGYANRVYQFPVGILVTAFLVPLFPVFSRYVAQKDFQGIKYYFNKGVGMLNFLAIPIFVLILLLASDAVTLILQRGAFDAKASQMVTTALIFLSFSIIPYVFRDSVTRIFYAFNDSKTPFLVALSSVILKFFLNWALIDKLGIGAITLSTSLVTLYNACVLGFFLRRKIKLGYTQFFKDFLKMSFAGLLSFILSYGLYKLLWFENLSWILLFAKTFIIFIFCVISYLVFTYLLKIKYINELLIRLKNKVQNGFK